MKERKLTCSYCSEKFLKDELTYVTKSKKACKSCQESRVQEALDYKELITYICNGFNISKPTGQQVKSIKKFKENGYSYKEIQYTIFYIFSILGKKVNGTSIELVPYYHEQAMEHLRQYNNMKSSADNYKVEAKTVKVVNPSKKHSRNKGTRYIDISSLD